MSKIGRKPILIGDVTVTVAGSEIQYKGKKDSGVYVLPDFITAQVQDRKLTLSLSSSERTHKAAWGMHRAILANRLSGAAAEFEKKLIINGLGFKAVLSGQKITFALGFSHKIDLDLPAGIKLDLDKTGQQLLFKSSDKEVLGKFCDAVRSLRPPEPYKGTGIKYADEHIIRKAGKTKAAG